MPPKSKKNNKSEQAATESDLRLPSVDPIVAARHQQVEKWIQRLQEVSRDASHARRQRGLLLRKLGELEEALHTTNNTASDIAFAPLRPPPPVAAPVVPSPRQRSKSIVKLKSSAAAADLEVVPQWKAPEPAEARKLTRIGNEMMHYYHAPKDGFPANAVKEKKGNVSRSLYKPQSKAASSPTSSKTPPLSSSAMMSAAGSMSIQQQADLPSVVQNNNNKGGGKTPRGTDTKQQKTPRGANNKGDSSKDGGTLSRKESIAMATMSLAGGAAAAPTPATHPDEEVSHKKGGNKKNQNKRDTANRGASSAPPTSSASAAAAAATKSGAFEGDESANFKVGRRGSRSGFMSAAGASCSMNGSMFAEVLIPYSAVLDRPPAISPANWDVILRLRATRIDTSERISDIQASLVKAQARVGVVKERERIAAYSLLAAHRSLAAAGSSRDLVGVLPPGISEKITAALVEPSELTITQMSLHPQQSVTLCADTTDVQLPPIGAAALKAQRSGVLHHQ